MTTYPKDEIRTIRHDEFDVFGRTIIVDTAVVLGRLETMILYADNGMEIDCAHPEDEKAAEAVHESYIERYIRGNELVDGILLNGKYKQLCEDLQEAVKACDKYRNLPDNGDENCDRLILTLSRYDTYRTLIAAHKAGLVAKEGRYRRAKAFFIDAPYGGKAFQNKIQIKAMHDAMYFLNYNVDIYHMNRRLGS